jgi:manganese/zinc/iron transport system substrate-binding protein
MTRCNMIRLAFLLTLVLVGASSLLGCDRKTTAPPGGKLKVVATTTMVGDLVSQIAGDSVELKVIMGAGTDPHSYKPSPADFEDLKSGRLVFYSGLHLEGKMVELFEEKLKDKAFAVTRDMPKDRLLPWQQGEGGAHDPHVWFDVTLWQHAAKTVGAELSKADPDNAAAYQRRLDDLLQQLNSLHQDLLSEAKKVPQEKRVLITSHDAFNYFGRTYGFQVNGLQGISTETEAGMQAIQGAVDFIVKNKVPAIFVESSVSHKTIERVRDDCRQRGFPVEIGGELYSDAMGTPGQHPPFPVETYEGMMRYNMSTLAKALSK